MVGEMVQKNSIKIYAFTFKVIFIYIQERNSCAGWLVIHIQSCLLLHRHDCLPIHCPLSHLRFDMHSHSTIIHSTISAQPNSRIVPRPQRSFPWANMASDSLDGLEGTIRRCIREEIKLSTPRPDNRELLNRIRSLIQSATSSAVQEIGTSSTVTPVPIGGKRRFKNAVPGHPFRPLRFNKKKKVKEQIPIPQSVYLVDYTTADSDDQDSDSFRFRKSDVVMKGEVDLTPGESEDEIRRELAEVFQTKLPGIFKCDFDFVKRDKNTMSYPAVKSGYKWDFSHVKNLCGQGRLYVRLNVPRSVVEARDETDSELLKPACPSLASSSSMSTPQLPGPTSVQKITGKDVDTLKAVFPRLAEVVYNMHLYTMARLKQQLVLWVNFQARDQPSQLS